MTNPTPPTSAGVPPPADLTIEYHDGTRAWWTLDEDQIQAVEALLGDPEGMRC